jgi:hypothetical protein
MRKNGALFDHSSGSFSLFLTSIFEKHSSKGYGSSVWQEYFDFKTALHHSNRSFQMRFVKPGIFDNQHSSLPLWTFKVSFGLLYS